jgi:2-dehydro-3-deoxyphosphogluconate aldolase / (4S)-4-hydroxy-2-oxoglutarate aldolase
MPAVRDRPAVLDALTAGGLVPVIRADSSSAALRVTEALVAGGVTTIEITMTVPDATDAIAAVRRTFGDRVLLGAGTVTTTSMLSASLDAGAEFIVTPCVVPDVITGARARDVAILPGAMTPTEVFTAWSLGGDIIKIFPASHVGGASYLRALKAPFPHIRFCPTGGVNLQTIGECFAAGASAVGVGGELVLKSALQSGDYGAITALARQYVDAVSRARA